MKNIFARPITLCLEIFLTLMLLVFAFFYYLSNLKNSSGRYADGVVTEYNGIIKEKESNFIGLTMLVEEELTHNPTLPALNKWLQDREQSMYKAYGDQVFDGFYLTYKGGFARSWTYGDYSKYQPESRPWYQMAQHAGLGKVIVVPPYIGYNDAQQSKRSFLMTIAKKYNATITMAMDLRLDTISGILRKRLPLYPETLSLLLNKEGFVMSTNEDKYYGLNITEEAMGSELQKIISWGRTHLRELRFATLNGEPKIIYAFAGPYNENIIMIYPFWYIVGQDLAFPFLLALLLILVEGILFLVARREERKQAEINQALQLALLSAQNSAKAKADFLSRMSHDIRTPLNGIIGMTYIAQDTADHLRIRDCLSKIDTSSKFLLGLVNEILSLSKAENEKITLHPEPYSLKMFREYVDAVIKPLCEEKNQQLVFEVDIIPKAYPVLDILRVNQIFFNLLSNAVKYTREGGCVTFKLHDQLAQGNKLALDVWVIDNGIGITKEFQKHLFDPFSQEYRDDNSEMRGTGLGLAIVKKLVDLMAGTITVDSQIGKGSAFKVHLEFPCTSSIAAPETNSTSINMADLEGKHALVCEDHPLNQEIIKVILTKKKITVSLADNGQIGVDMFKNSLPGYYDFILMDIRMPVKDGYAATAEIRSLTRSDAKAVPIIAITADVMAADRETYLHNGMDGCVVKPIEPENFFRTILEVLAAKSQQK